MLELLLLIGIGAACKGIVASTPTEESKKKGKKKSNYSEGLMSRKTYSWTNQWENPDTGDYVKHWIDIDVK